VEFVTIQVWRHILYAYQEESSVRIQPLKCMISKIEGDIALAVLFALNREFSKRELRLQGIKLVLQVPHFPFQVGYFLLQL